jgi:hypothetical protein
MRFDNEACARLSYYLFSPVDLANIGTVSEDDDVAINSGNSACWRTRPAKICVDYERAEERRKEHKLKVVKFEGLTSLNIDLSR